MLITFLQTFLRPTALLVLTLMLSACIDLDLALMDDHAAQSAPERQADDRHEADGGEESSSSAVPSTTGSGSVAAVADARTVVLPGGKTRIGAKDFVDLPARDVYWLDYTMTFEDGFYFTRGGKLPGLAGGRSTTGCASTDPAGWSARLGWALEGVGNLYVYDQNRDGQCGDNNFFPELRFDSGGTHRVTQWVKVNTPGRPDGAIKVWLDGELAIALDALELRGNVDSSQARVDNLAYAVFSGGKTAEFEPPRDQAIRFGPMHVLTCAPDFSVPTPRCAAS